MLSSFRDAGAFLRSHAALRRVLIGLVVFGVLLGAALVAVPLVVKSYAEGWLRDNGAVAARIGDVDLNPFTGRATLTGLVAGSEPGAELRVDEAEIDLRWWPLTSRRVFVERLRLAGVRADVVARDDGAWQVGGLVIRPGPAQPAADEPSTEGPVWGFGSELVMLRDVRLSYADGTIDTRVDVRELRIGSQYSWDAGRSTALVMDLTVNGSPLVLRSDVVPWSDEPSLAGRLTLADFEVAEFASELETLAGIEGAGGTISMDLEISGRLDADGVLRLSISGPLNLDDAALAVAGAEVGHRALRWDGVVELALPAPAEQPLARLDGALQLTGATVGLADAALAARLGDLRWQGTLALSAPPADEAPARVTSRAEVRLGGLELRRSDLDVLLVALAEGRIEGLDIAGPTDVDLAELRFQGLRLLAPGTASEDAGALGDLLDVAELSVSDVRIDGASVGIALLRIDEPSLVVVRDEAGGIERLSAVLAAYGDPSTAPAEGAAGPDLEETAADAQAVAEESPAFAFEVGRVEITGSRWLEFSDRSVAPPAAFKLATLNLVLENVSSRPGEPIRVDLETGADNTRLAVKGTLDVLAASQSADLEVDVENLEMPPFSPYVPGYDVFRGRLSTETRVVLAGEKLDVENDLMIERLKLASKGGADDVLSQGMAMPVDVALDLLRDRDDRIRLSLPVTGSLDNPSFGTGDIVRQAMQKALQNAAVSYVKNALQPLGTLLLVGNLAAKAARPRFEPVVMTAGDSALPPSGREYLDKLTGLLEQRPGLSLTICGVATEADRQALVDAALARRAADQAAGGDEETPAVEGADTPDPSAAATAEPPPPQISDAALLDLAGLRTSRVISELAGAVSRERLFACRESIDADAEALPRVEISL